ncbi:WD40 repeat domain-containing protein [Pararhodonellum marinum]|uniref:WD40 repeat domain-containing protein n=1 Tax=Pararhodonellum marinum TaxID=2755358 RepID=UPI00188FC219|nr:WD40 repeat domain-containing protein [Pararhodonellum marinum]
MSNIQVNKLHTLTGHNDSIYALVEGSDPRFFYTGAGDGMVVSWDLEAPKDGKLVAKLPHSVYALAVDKANNVLYIGHNYEGIHAIDLENFQELWSLKITNQSIFDIKVFGNLLLVGTADGVISILDIKQRSPLKHLKIAEKSVRVMSIHPTKKQLAVGLSDHSVKIIDLDTFKPMANLKGHTNSVFALGFSPDGNTLVSGGRDAKLLFWDGMDYQEKNQIVAHMYAINYLDYREDGKCFVTCSMDKSIKIWDAQTFKLLKVIDKSRHAGHGTSINKVLWSSFNQKIVAISDDRTISIWDIVL